MHAKKLLIGSILAGLGVFAAIALSLPALQTARSPSKMVELYRRQGKLAIILEQAQQVAESEDPTGETSVLIELAQEESTAINTLLDDLAEAREQQSNVIIASTNDPTMTFATLMGVIVSAIGTISSLVLSWRKDLRDMGEGAVVVMTEQKEELAKAA
ncbi:hypothetical protein V22_00240 [Calycomorphotria hydatis]|uniref:Uncharacterized protein n=2 Tax=Calycomorphotria hydatis TaxID=2528027 RepID=A0A517T384_9PLAN|nr:hypothetical protein V22_00240 [Calycomorphotria hydatis]